MKKIIAIAALVFAASSVQASWLYWQVEDMGYKEGQEVPYCEWDTANLYALDSSGKKVGEAAIQSAAGVNGTTEARSYDMSTLANASTYSYYIELVNSSTGVLAAYTSNPQTYVQLEQSGSIVGTTMDISSVTLWHGGTYNAPEPTSALLMMLGVAGLALKRKQRKVDEV